jgi:hypothetical protein
VTVISTTTPASNQVVITPLPDFRLGAFEPLPVGLKRLTTTEMANAASRFYDGEEAFPIAVHQARKSTKRVRAVLRLVRADLGEKIYKYENQTLRDAARRIAPVRDSLVAVETSPSDATSTAADWPMTASQRSRMSVRRRTHPLRAWLAGKGRLGSTIPTALAALGDPLKGI